MVELLYIRYYLGKLLVGLLLPLWLLLGILWWKESTLFVVVHIDMLISGTKEDIKRAKRERKKRNMLS